MLSIREPIARSKTTWRKTSTRPISAHRPLPILLVSYHLQLTWKRLCGSIGTATRLGSAQSYHVDIAAPHPCDTIAFQSWRTWLARPLQLLRFCDRGCLGMTWNDLCDRPRNSALQLRRLVPSGISLRQTVSSHLLIAITGILLLLRRGQSRRIPLFHKQIPNGNRDEHLATTRNRS